MRHVKHVVRGDPNGLNEDLVTIVFNDTISPPWITFTADVAKEVATELNAHFARRLRFERELENRKELKLISHVGKDDETDGGQGPEVA